MIHVLLNGALPEILSWVTQHGYPFIFFLMVFEGQATIVVSSFAANLGYFDITTIFILAFLSDIVADCVWYAVGHYGSKALIKKFGHLFGTNGRIKRLGRFFAKHPGKTLAVIKCSPFIAVPGILMISSSISFKKFIKIALIIIVPKTIFLVALGYFFGGAYELIRLYINNTFFALIIIIAFAWLIMLLYKDISFRLSKKLEREDLAK